jgi:hypothetical protein
MARRKKRASKAGRKSSAVKTRVRTMRSRKPKAKSRRSVRGKYSGGR